jgi:hypothetical protein
MFGINWIACLSLVLIQEEVIGQSDLGYKVKTMRMLLMKETLVRALSWHIHMENAWWFAIIGQKMRIKIKVALLKIITNSLYKTHFMAERFLHQKGFH